MTNETRNYNWNKTYRDDTENKMLWAGKAADLLEETWREKKGRKTPKMGLRTL